MVIDELDKCKCVIDIRIVIVIARKVLVDQTKFLMSSWKKYQKNLENDKSKQCGRTIKLDSWNSTEKDFVGKCDPYTEVLVVVTLIPLSTDLIFQRSPFQPHFKHLIWPINNRLETPNHNLKLALENHGTFIMKPND